MTGLQSLTYRILSTTSLILESLYIDKIPIMDDFYASRTENPLQSRLFVLLKFCLTTRKIVPNSEPVIKFVNLTLVDLMVAKNINEAGVGRTV